MGDRGILNLLHLLLIVLLYSLLPLISVVAITREECMELYLPERVACYDSASPSDCGPLPIPEEAYPTQELNEQGYALIHLRNTSNTQIYAVTDNTVITLIVLDLPATRIGAVDGDEAEVVTDTAPLTTSSRTNDKEDNADGSKPDNQKEDDNARTHDKGKRWARRKLRAIKGVSSKAIDHRRLEEQNRKERKPKKQRSNKRQPKDDVQEDSFEEANPLVMQEDSLEEGYLLLPVEDSVEEEQPLPTHEPSGTVANLPTFPPESGSPDETEPATQSPVESAPPVPDTTNPPTQSSVGAERVHVAIIDHPEAFLTRDPDTGDIMGNLNLLALEEILLLHGYEKTDIAAARLVYTHGHTDHTGGANITYPVLKEEWMVPDVAILATESVRDTYETVIDLGLWTNRAPLPDTTFDSEEPIVLPVGDNTVIHLHPTDGHTHGGSEDLIVYIESDGDEPPILFYVDAIYPEWSPFFRFGTSELLSYIALHDKLLEFDLEPDGVFIGGHVNQVGTREDILVNQDLVNTVLDASAEALRITDINPMARELGFFDPSSAYYNNRWALFRQYLKVVNNKCAKVVVEQFGCELAGIDAVADSLCDMGQLFWGIVA